MRKFGILCLATGGFVGYAPVAPGTFGTLVGVALVWCLQALTPALMIFVALLLGVVGAWASHAAKLYLNQVDSPRIVIDEVVGFLVAMIGIPVTGPWLVAAFLAFRFFDIVKIAPADLIDARLKNGWGVMLDDVVAGIYSNVLLHLILKAEL